MREKVLDGPDGANPLGFLCALGLLRVLDQHATHASPRLSWRDAGYWRPVLYVSEAEPDPVEVVMADCETWKDALELSLEDLKVPMTDFQKFLQKAAEVAARTSRRAADFAVAYATDVVVDRKGVTRPTALHFTSGNQKFLRIAAALAKGVTETHVREALHGPWRPQDEIPALRWDASGERLHALMANAPTESKPPGVAGANWLAFHALPLFPTFPLSSRRLGTVGFPRGEAAFVWPLWNVPITLRTVRTLLAHPKLAVPDRAWQRALGITCVLRAAVHRPSGRYATFGAAESIPPQ